MENSLNFEGLPFDINDSVEKNVKVIEKYIKTSDRSPDTLVNMEMCREYLSRYLISCVKYEDMKLVINATNKLDRILTNSQRSMSKQSERYKDVVTWRDYTELPSRKLKLEESKRESNLLLCITGLLGVLFLFTFLFTKPYLCIISLALEIFWCIELFIYNKRKHLMPSVVLKFTLGKFDKNPSYERYERAMIWKTELLDHRNNDKLPALSRQLINSKGFNSVDTKFIEKVYENVIELDKN